jgi:hypothetical protein
MSNFPYGVSVGPDPRDVWPEFQCADCQWWPREIESLTACGGELLCEDCLNIRQVEADQ